MPKNNTTTRIIFVRHGTTDWLEKGLTHGRTDRPLSPYGLKEAELTAFALKDSKANRIYTSPMQRAVQTAQAISHAANIPIEIVEDLREIDFGLMEGKRNISTITNNKIINGIAFLFLNSFHDMMGGEPHRKFNKRIINTWEIIRSQSIGTTIIIVAHSFVIRTILVHEIKNEIRDPLDLRFGTCSISEIEIDENASGKIVRLNDTEHLLKLNKRENL